MGCNSSSSALSCCPNKEFVQDKVCSPWSGLGAVAAVDVIVYTNNITQNIVGTGYLQYDIGSGNVSLEVLDSTGAVIGTAITLTPGTSVAFTYRRFSAIQVVLPAASAGITFQGEFCITTRYPIS
ncbi:DUF3992 domain-containing protein [Paenibacillus psychroresistens]|uniref:DUF3992 domain-containing protein n=1 Tax=Paenibacillus psychroresistens TaxID=1778678 RepID=A0A6B8RTJ1_9BACL|nr:S-Ena type endospore appendage [Paenibacillus psychroresistens]QGQ98528.1 DUF3992 domain-containing protein [Paenibacillus psychroresistens]